ncbi:MAG: HAAS signaling domain-containing protein [Capsulimonadaceae bacterium]
MNNPPDNDRLRWYLSDVERQLWQLPETERAEQIDEVRQHLELLITRNLSNKSDPDDAVRRATLEFGDPVEIGREIASEAGWSGLDPGSLWTGVATGVVWFYVARLPFAWLGAFIFAGLSSVSESLRSLTVDMWAFKILDGTALVVVPAVAGICAAYAAPRYAGKSILIAAAIALTFISLPNAMASLLSPNPLIVRKIEAILGVEAGWWVGMGYLSAVACVYRLRRLRPPSLRLVN